MGRLGQMSVLFLVVAVASGRHAADTLEDLIVVAQCQSQCYTLHKEASGCISRKCPRLQNALYRSVEQRGPPPAQCGRDRGPHKLHMVCRAETKLILEWDELHVPEAGVPVYVLEIRSKDSDWQPLAVTPWTVYTAQNLTAATEYMFQVRTVLTDGHVGSMSCSDWIKTLQYGFKPNAIDRVRSNVVLEGAKLTALLTWEPPADKTCNYKVVMWNKTRVMEGERMIQGCSTPTLGRNVSFTCHKSSFDVVFKGLEFEQSYSVWILGQSADRKQESAKVGYTFRTPTCYAAHRNNGTGCRPSEPTILSVLMLKPRPGNPSRSNDVKVTWKSLTPTPLEYLVQLLTSDETFNRTLPGNQTHVVFPSVGQRGGVYVIKVKARSLAGFGPEAHTTRQYKVTIPEPSPVILEDKSIWSNFSILSTVLGVVVVILLALGCSMMILQQHIRRGLCQKIRSLEASFHL